MLAMIPLHSVLAASSGSFNPLKFDPAATALTLITFFSLLALLAKFAWKPILAAVEQREQRIENALTRSEADRAEAARLLAEYKAAVSGAEAELAALRERGRLEAEAVAAEIRARAEAEALARSEKARREIDQARAAAVAELHREAVDLGMAVATRVIGRSLDGADQRRLAEQTVADVAVAGKN